MSIILTQQKDHIKEQLMQWIDTDPKRLDVLAELIQAIPLSASVQSGDVAGNVSRDVQDRSISQMLRRFYMNEAVTWEDIYWPQVKRLVRSLRVDCYYLVIDTTDTGSNHRTVTLGLAYHGRSIPLVWTVEKGKKGHVSQNVQIELIRKLYSVFQPIKPVIFLGDSEFDGVRLQKQLKLQGWYYVLRTSSSTYIYDDKDGEGTRLGDLVPSVGAPEQTRTQIYFTSTHKFGLVSCFATWEEKQKEPLILVYSLPPNWKYTVRHTYRRRFWIEPLFGDCKEAGFRLNRTRIKITERLDNLVLAVSSAYIWMVSLGAWVIHHDDASLVDHTHRRTLSIFKTGWRWFRRARKLGHTILFYLTLPKSIDLKPYDCTKTCVG